MRNQETTCNKISSCQLELRWLTCDWFTYTIELRKVDDKKAALRAKAELRKPRKFRNVYIRGAQTHTERLIDLNFKAILNKMPNGNSYRITGNGRLVKKAEGGDVERRGWHIY